jgi:hypothetical protein
MSQASLVTVIVTKKIRSWSFSMPPSNKSKKAANFRYHVHTPHRGENLHQPPLHLLFLQIGLDFNFSHLRNDAVGNAPGQQKNRHPTRGGSGRIQFDGQEDDGKDDEMSIDQAYLDHTEEHGIEVAEGVKRVRFKGV